MKKIWFIILIFGGFGTFFLIYLSWNTAYSRARQIFDFEADQIRESVFERIQASDAVAKSMQAFFQASLMMDGDQFNIFAEKIIARYPFIHSVTYYPRVNQNDLRHFEADQQLFGMIGFRIYEYNSKGEKQTVADRQIYLPTLYRYPIDAGMIGYDAFSDPEMAKTITHAIDGGAAYPSAVRMFIGKNEYKVFIALYEGKHLPDSSSLRQKQFNGLISLTIHPESLFEGIVISKEFSVRLENNSLSNTYNKNSALVFQNLSASAKFRLKLTTFYHLIVSAQKFDLIVSKHLSFSEIDIWLVIFAIGVGLIGSGAAFVILRGRLALKELNRDLEHRVKERTADLEQANKNSPKL